MRRFLAQMAKLMWQLKRMPDANNLRWRKRAKAKLTMNENEKLWQ